MEDIDPYYMWLGIAPEEQPPNHYRLLGLRTFEGNPEVIREAAFRQMAHVRTYQLGPHQETSQRILNELAAARSCLLDLNRKGAYDQALHAVLETGSAAEPPPSPPPVQLESRRPRKWALSAVASSCLVVAVAGLVVLTSALRRPPPGHVGEARKADVSLPATPTLPPQAAQAESGDLDEPKPQAGPVKPPPAPEEFSKDNTGPEWQRDETQPESQGPTAPKANGEEQAIAPQPPSPDPTPPVPPASYGLVVLQWPEKERTDAALFFDGQRYPLPPSGPVEFQRPLGACRLEATRPGHERFVKKITVAQDRTVRVQLAWKPAAKNSVNFSGVWRSSSGSQYRLEDDGNVIQVKLADPSREYFSGRLIRHGRDELRSTLWEATFANDRLHRRWKLRAEFTVISDSELQCRYEKVIWGNVAGQVERVFPNHSTWNKAE